LPSTFDKEGKMPAKSERKPLYNIGSDTIICDFDHLRIIKHGEDISEFMPKKIYERLQGDPGFSEKSPKDKKK